MQVLRVMTLALGVLAVLVLVLAAPKAEAKWTKYKTDLAVVYSEVSDARTRDFIADIHGLDATLRLLFSVPANRKTAPLRLYIFENKSDLTAILPGLPDRVLGVYSPSIDSLRIMVSGYDFFPNTSFEVRAREVVLHEYAHHFTFQHLTGAYPAWFIEGIAEWVSTARFAKGKVEIGDAPSGRGRAIASGDWAPLDVILTKPAHEASFDARAGAYEIGWLLTHYFYSDAAREQKFLQYLQKLRQDPDQSIAHFEEVMGKKVGAVQGDLRRYARGRLPVLILPLAGGAPPQVEGVPLAADESALLATAEALRGTPRPDVRPDLLAKAEADLAKFPQSALAHRSLGHALAWADRFDEAMTRLEKAAALDPADAETLALQGMVLVLKARDKAISTEAAASLRAEALRRLDEAAALDPLLPQIWFHRAEALDDDAGRAPIDSLLRARALAPQVQLTAMRLGERFLRAGLAREVEIVLARLASDPHGGDMADRAQRMIEAAKAGLRALPPAEAGNGSSRN